MGTEKINRLEKEALQILSDDTPLNGPIKFDEQLSYHNGEYYGGDEVIYC